MNRPAQRRGVHAPIDQEVRTTRGHAGARVNRCFFSTGALFGAEQTLPIQGFLPVVNNREYDVFPDGKQFVMVFPVNRQDSGAVPAAQINAVLNWTEELKTRVPVKAR